MKHKRTYGFKFLLMLTMLVAAIGALSLQAQITHAQVGGQITYGSSVFGTVSAAVPSTAFSFNGAVGDLVEVDVKGVTGGLDPAVDLIGPDQQIVASSQRNRLIAKSQDAHIAQFLPQSGVYTLRVSGVGGTAGDFALRLHGRPIVPSTRLIYGQAVQVNIQQNAASQYFTFVAEDCPTTLTVTNLADGEPFTFPFVVKVRNQQGREIAQLKGGDAQEDRVTVAALSGQYEVDVFADDPLLAGMVSLLVSCAADAPGCTGGGATAAVGADCPPCPDCPTDGRGPSGVEPVCPDMQFTTVPGSPGVTLTWAAVPGADHYYIHFYGKRDDDEIYLGAVGVPGDATDYHMDDFPEGFYGFSFVIEALQVDTVLCKDETEILRAERRARCENFNVTGVVESHVDRTVTWTWTAYPGADVYAGEVMFILPDGTEALLGTDSHEPETTSALHTYELHVAPSDIWRYRVHVVIGGEIICTAEDTIEFEPRGPDQVEWPECENFTVTGHIDSQADRTVTWSWTAYPGAEAYVGLVQGLLPDGSFGAGSSFMPPGVETSVTHDYGDLGDREYDTFTLTIGVIIGAEVICEADGIIEFEPQGPDYVEWPECENFAVWLIDQTATSVSVGWSEYPGAEQYWFYILDAAGMMVPGFPTYLPPSQLNGMVELAPGTYTIGVAPWISPDGVICLEGLSVTIGDSATTAPCEIRTDQANVRVHVGPGRNRNVFTYLDVGRNYTVVGQALDDEGNVWWQIDKTQVPGHEAVLSLWVAESDVTEIGNCTDVAQGEVPAVIPDDGGGNGPGTWLGCGSCNTCGHPANECVTAPDGQCLWDPTFCQEAPDEPDEPDEPVDPVDPNQPDEPDEPQLPECYVVGATATPSGTGTARPITSGNCGTEIPGLYRVGTNVQLQAFPNPGCWVVNWSGCGTSGSSATVTVHVTGNCTAVATLGCME